MFGVCLSLRLLLRLRALLCRLRFGLFLRFLLLSSAAHRPSCCPDCGSCSCVARNRADCGTSCCTTGTSFYCSAFRGCLSRVLGSLFLRRFLLLSTCGCRCRSLWINPGLLFGRPVTLVLVAQLSVCGLLASRIGE